MHDEHNPLASLGAAGGHARAKKLSTEERSAIARKAAIERWEQEGKGLPRAAYPGKLTIGDLELEVAVLDDAEHTRVVSEAKFMAAMGMYRSGAVSVRRKEEEGGGANIPLFLAHKNLKPFIEKHLGAVHFDILRYRSLDGNVAHGIRAELLPKVCEIWIDADRAGVLGARQKLIAAKHDILLRGFAHVGIIALVDEATGFQDDRARDALAKILEAFVTTELRKWVKSFPVDFYKEMFRLRGLPYTGAVKKPAYIGHLTNDLVYARLAPGVLAALREKNPVAENGRRRSKHHQWLTPDIGHPKLQEHLASVTTLMRVSSTWDDFKALLDKGLPRYSNRPLLRVSEE